MKAVLISIHPRHCENIASGKKTVEVRKTAPKLKMPFKVYIYCTSVKSLPMEEYVALHSSTGGLCDKWSGRVIGEFVCDRIDTIRDEGNGFVAGGVQQSEWRSAAQTLIQAACLMEKELKAYLGYDYGFGWHISDLKIYDKPKELGAFIAPCKWGHRIDDEDYECLLPRPEEKCQYECADKNPDGSVNIFTCGLRKPFTRPPQSWCYVEEI